MLSNILLAVGIVLLWTGVREVLLDRYAHAQHPHALRNSGLILSGVIVASTLLVALLG